MARLTDYTLYADAQRNYSKEALWALFDGDRQQLNIGHECVDRHDRTAIAVRIAHEDGTDETITFGELASTSNRFANFLLNKGLSKGDRIAIMLEPSLPFYVALFGAMKAGCIAVPLFTLFGPEGLRLRIDDCTPKLLITNSDLAHLAANNDDIETVVTNNTFLTALETESDLFTPQTASSDMAMYQYTSGTTRELPEAVKHRHRAVVTVILAALYGTGIRPSDRFMCPSSPAWGHGLWHGTISPLALGVSTASYAGKFDPVRLMQAIQDYEITNIAAAATHFRLMKNSGAANHFTFCVEKLSFTGEPIDSDTAAWTKATFGGDVCSMYGTTEIGVILADYPGAADHKVKPGSLGRPIPGIELAVHDPNRQNCPTGQIGEIMMKRRNGWFPTKDLGWIDEDGYFYHGGRADDVIISAGYTMSAVEIEDVLLKHPDVDETAVIGAPDDERGLVVKSFIVSKRPGDDSFAKELQEFTANLLSRHEYPRRVAFVEVLPKTPAGKVNRKALRDAEQAAQPEG
ncbi:MAG: acyl-CoA synthetase [Pseudomonadota bacterium]|nr:acyl-CoA synthetase [Pseudomonadota bacterium]